MEDSEIKTVLSRASMWPKAAQEELVQAAREIEEEFVVNDQLIAELDEAHREAARGDGAALDDVKERLGL